MVRFYKTQTQFEDFHARIKLILCPHCKKSGFLILHGGAYGYSEQENSRILRGHRIYCSNRNNRNGCGKTFSILAAGLLPGFIISAQSLWLFLESILNGFCLAHAFRTAKCAMTPSSVYRLYKKFALNQMRIRSFLSRIKDPPALKHVKSPFLQTILHLKTAFDNTVCPVTEFQFRFQTSFFQ